MVKRNSNRGFVTAIAVVISLAVLGFFGAIYHVVQNSIRENIVIDLRDQSGSLAEAAVQQVIHKIRANPDLKKLDENIIDKDRNLIPSSFRNGQPDSLGFWDVYHRNYPNEVKDKDGKKMGLYFSKVKSINIDDPAKWDNVNSRIFKDESEFPVAGNIFHVMTEGWAVDKRGREMSRSTVHSFVYLSNVGEYFCAVKGHLKVSREANLGTGKIYGRSIEFDMGGQDFSISVGEANYDVEALPDPWPDNVLDPNINKVRIAAGDDLVIPGQPTYGYKPRRLKSPLHFPSINEHITYYEDPDTIPIVQRADPYFPDVVAGGVITSACQFGDPVTAITLTPPSVFVGYGYPKTDNNKDHIYYCDDPSGVWIGNVTVVGQVIIVARGKVKIGGNIEIADGDEGLTPKSDSQCIPAGQPGAPGPNCYTAPPDLTGTGNLLDFPAGGIPSTADQLVIYAGEGFEIDTNWCNNVAGDHLKLQGVLLIAPDAGLTYNVTSPICGLYANYSLDFLGAMYFSDQPSLGGIFAKLGPPANLIPPYGRKYRYLGTFATDPPPVRQSFQILKQFALRKAMPVASPSPW